jgi:hypothetical protein
MADADQCLSRPSRWAIAAASPRPATPSLARILETWTLAVLGVMNSAWPICRLVRPSATSANTLTSRRVRPSEAAGADAGEAGDVLDGQAARSVSFTHRVGFAGLRRVATLFADELIGVLVSKLRYAERASRAGVALRGMLPGGAGRPSSGGALVPARRTVPQRSW